MSADNSDQMRRNIEEVFSKYERWANVKYDGEEITLLEHSLQIARLAEEAGCEESVILGAFFHDFGHVLEVEESFLPFDKQTYVVGKHHETGYAALKKLNFPESIASVALHHVNAKRYLVYHDDKYYEGLSETSKRTLIVQGGAMGKDEADAFENLDYFEAIINARRWDDQAKVVNKITPQLGKYKDMCMELLTR